MKPRVSSGNKLLLLTDNEIQLLQLLKNSLGSTPASLAKQCSIPRPTIYITLDKLEERGLVQSRRIGKRKIWEIVSEDALQSQLEQLRHLLIPSRGEYQQVNVSSNTDLAIYRGEKTILKLFTSFVEKHSGSRLLGVQGDFAGDAWKNTIKTEDINTINAKIKKNKLITEFITSKKWFQRQIGLFGKSWAENFMGRAAQIHFVDHKYLDYESQIFLFENKLYLVSMRDKLFIEVKNQHISKLIISLIKFIEDHSKSVDINEMLKKMTDENN